MQFVCLFKQFVFILFAFCLHFWIWPEYLPHAYSRRTTSSMHFCVHCMHSLDTWYSLFGSAFKLPSSYILYACCTFGVKPVHDTAQHCKTGPFCAWCMHFVCLCMHLVCVLYTKGIGDACGLHFSVHVVCILGFSTAVLPKR